VKNLSVPEGEKREEARGGDAGSPKQVNWGDEGESGGLHRSREENSDRWLPRGMYILDFVKTGRGLFSRRAWSNLGKQLGEMGLRLKQMQLFPSAESRPPHGSQEGIVKHKCTKRSHHLQRKLRISYKEVTLAASGSERYSISSSWPGETHRRVYAEARRTGMK